MRALQAISTTLFLIGIGFFAFDVVCHLLNLALTWFGFPAAPLVEDLIKKMSMESLWKAISKDNYEVTRAMSTGVVSPFVWDTAIHLPAPTALIAIAVVLYIPYKVLRLIGVGKEVKYFK